MKPVVNKIRVGDVLFGTKNLRNYLRTCSLLRYFQMLSDSGRYGGKVEASEIIYTPKKTDPFVVAANTDGRFLVWSPNKQVILFFYNGSRPSIGGLEAPKRMDAHTFAKWFTRTDMRWPDVRSWPIWAYYHWASIQLNACRNRETSLPFNYHYGPGSNARFAPFDLHRSVPNNIDPATIKHAVHESIRYGTFRNEGKAEMHFFSGHTFGPRLEDVNHMREEIRHLTRDPRMLSRAKVKEEDFQFLMNVKQNPL